MGRCSTRSPPIVITMQRAIWGNRLVRISGGKPRTVLRRRPEPLSVVVPAEPRRRARVSVVLLLVAFRIFGRLEDNFAENI